MKVKKQKATPCLKKGIDNELSSSRCELESICKARGDYLNSDSELYTLCLKAEEHLTENNLIRYELREMSGLEVLFEGIERIYNLNAEVFNYDHFEGIGPNDFAQMTLSLESNGDLKQDLLLKSEDVLARNEKVILVESFKGSDSEPNILNHLPESLGFTQSFAHDLLASSPENLFDSHLQKLYQEGQFEPLFIEIKGETKSDRIKRELKDDDFHCVATLLLKGIEDIKDIKRFWPRYTKSRYDKNKNKVYALVNREMPVSFKKFNKIWNLLTNAQSDALVLEHFHGELEKPTQEQNALKLGISIASYQDRLELAFNKLSKLYPEYKRKRRRKPRTPKPKVDKENRRVSPTQMAEIRQWARKNMDDYFNSHKNLVQDWVIVETEEDKKIEDKDS